MLYGIEAIAKFIGLSKRQTDHQIRNGEIPVRRLGYKVVSRKSALRRHFAVDEETS
jgi:hypothetical protein